MKPSNAVHRGLLHPRSGEHKRKTYHRMYGSCTTPVHLQVEPHEGSRYTDVLRAVRCRRCQSCLRARQYQWKLRSEHEMTTVRGHWWLFTGTFAEQTWDRDEAADRVTRWLKRLRFAVGESRTCASPGPRGGRCRECASCTAVSNVRYLVAFERHKSGAWHVHALVLCNDLSQREILATWQMGRVRCDHIHGTVNDWSKTAGYVTKYVTKDMSEDDDERRPRVRASHGWGEEVVNRDPEEVAALVVEKTVQDVWWTNMREVIRKARSEMRRPFNPLHDVVPLQHE